MITDKLLQQLDQLSEKERKEFFAQCMQTYPTEFTLLFRDWLYSFDIADLEANFSGKKDDKDKKP